MRAGWNEPARVEESGRRPARSGWLVAQANGQCLVVLWDTGEVDVSGVQFREVCKVLAELKKAARA